MTYGQTDQLLDRRGFLALAGAAALGELSGCSSTSEYRQNPTTNYTGTPQPTYSSPQAEPEPRRDSGYRPANTHDQRKRELREKINWLETIYWQPQMSVWNGPDMIGVIASEQEGMRQLKFLANIGQQEVAWLSIPEADAWINVGKYAAPEVAVKFDKAFGVDRPPAIMGGVEINQPYIDRLIYNNKDLIHRITETHTHPKVAEDMNFENTLKRLEKAGRKVSQEEMNSVKYWCSIQNALPSARDLETSMRIISGTATLGIDQCDAIVSRYVCRVSLTDEGKKYFLGKLYREEVAYQEQFWKESGVYEVQLPRELWGVEDPENPKVSEARLKDLKRICQKASNRHLIVTISEE